MIASRTQTITEAVQSPLDGDYLELSRMVPEKLAAFSLSGNVVMQAWWKMQADWIGQAQQVRSMMMQGRLPTLNEITVAVSRSSLYALRTLEAGASASRAAVTPVHKSLTANARRLRKRSGKAPSRRKSS